MMMGGDRKKLVSLIISGSKTKQAPTNDAGEELSQELAMKSAVNDMFKSFNSGDQQYFLSALKAFIEMCFEELQSEEKED